MKLSDIKRMIACTTPPAAAPAPSERPADQQPDQRSADPIVAQVIAGLRRNVTESVIAAHLRITLDEVIAIRRVHWDETGAAWRHKQAEENARLGALEADKPPPWNWL